MDSVKALETMNAIDVANWCAKIIIIIIIREKILFYSKHVPNIAGEEGGHTMMGDNRYICPVISMTMIALDSVCDMPAAKAAAPVTVRPK